MQTSVFPVAKLGLMICSHGFSESSLFLYIMFSMQTHISGQFFFATAVRRMRNNY